MLQRPDSYPEKPATVTVVETHMSWVFLTDAHAYKLKKAIRFDSVDLEDAASRLQNCLTEVRVNHRFAPGVYLGLSVVVRRPDGTLGLDEPGMPIDWLVKMRRLPADRMLHALIVEGRASAEVAHIRGAAQFLAGILADAPPVPMTGTEYRTRLVDGARADELALIAPRYGLSTVRLAALASAQITLLERHPHLFEGRVRAGRVIEGHGDLRPEHICVADPPVIIDGLEFSETLRVLDPVDELSFLSLECERLGDARVGGWFMNAYVDRSGDRPPGLLVDFYRVYRAMRRARIAAQHLDDPTVREPGRFAAQARRYLELVEPVRCPGSGRGVSPVQGSSNSSSGRSS